MATINGVEVIGDKAAHDFDLLDKDDGINLSNGIERNREATEDNHEDIVLHRTDTDVHVTPAWKNSLVTKEILGLYWTAAQTADIINEISIAGGAKLVKVDELPETGKEQTIYLVPKQDATEGDIFNEYVWIDGKFEFIGTTKVDLSNYATKTELNTKQDALSNQQLSNIDDVANKANDADVVHKSGAETINGVKTFSDTTIAASSRTHSSQISADRINGIKTDFSANNGFKIICDKNSDAWNNTAAAIHLTEYSPTNSSLNFKIFDCIDGGTSCKGFVLRKKDNDYHLIPNVTNAIDLGTSSNKWKTFNGVNPGSLSLPSTDTGYANIKATVGAYLRDNNTSIYEFTAQFDGWITVGVKHGSLRIDNVTLDFSSGSEIIGYWQSYTIPFRKNDVIQVKINKMNATDDYVENVMWRAFIYPCQGNV